MRLYFVLLICLCGLNNAFSTNSYPSIKRGYVELGNWNFNTDGTVALKGNWEFYWNKLYTQEDFLTNKNIAADTLFVPGTWSNKIIDGKPLPNIGYATYRLIINSNNDAKVVIFFKEIISSYKVWINGKEIAGAGIVSDNGAIAKPEFKINKELAELERGRNEIIIQVSNFNHRLNGFEYAPLLGSLQEIDKIELRANLVDFIILGVLLIMAFYHLGLFIFRKKNISFLLFSVFCFVAIIRVFVSANYPFGHFANISWQILYFLKYITLYTLCPLVVLLVQTTFTGRDKKWLFYSYYILSAVFIATLIFPSLVYTRLLIIYEAISIVYVVLTLGGMLIKYVMMRIDGAAILLISLLLFVLTGINDMLYFQDVLKTTELFSVGIFILVLGQALTLGKQFSTLYYTNEELTISLDNKNKNLIELVQERTVELEEEKMKLKASNKTLAKYFTAIEQAHVTVVITDIDGNIEYANPQMEKVTGYSFMEIIGKNPRILSSGKTPRNVFEDLWKTLKDGQVWKGELINKKKNQEEFIEKVTISPVTDNNNQIVNFIAIKEDITKIKKAENALRESEEKYRLITENTQDVIWKMSLSEMKFTYVSPSVYSLRGYTPEEVMSAPVGNSMTPGSFRKFLEQLKGYVEATQRTRNLSLRSRYQQPCKNGMIIDIEATSTFIVNENGTPVEIIGVSRDITDQVKIENALKVSQSKLAELLESQTIKSRHLLNQLNYIYNNTSSGIAFFSIVGEDIFFSSCNSRWANSLGHTPKELEGNNIKDFCDTETASLYERFIFQAISEDRMVQEYCKWNGMDLYVNLIPIKDEQSNNIKTCASFVYDVTEQLQTELKIRESEAKFFNIFNNTKDAIVVLTPDLKVVEVNRSFYTIFGKPERSKTNRNLIKEFVPPKFQKKILKLKEQLKNEGTISTFECELIKFDQSLISVEFNSSLIIQNKEPLILCIIRDVTVRKQMERLFTQVGIQIENRERRKLASDLHDNVGPLLSSMNMYLSTLSRKQELEPHQEVITDVRRILKDTIASVREISNNISPQVLTNYGLTSALEMFFETKRKLANIIIENSIGELRFAETKETMIYSIIKEAFNNSIKYSGASEISLHIYEKNTFIHVLYKDNGIGFILEEKLAKVTTSLGLFSIINRVKNLDGEYSINTKPGKGFALEVIFPIEIIREDVQN